MPKILKLEKGTFIIKKYTFEKLTKGHQEYITDMYSNKKDGLVAVCENEYLYYMPGLTSIKSDKILEKHINSVWDDIHNHDIFDELFKSDE